MPEIIILIGEPASGKSTWRAANQKDHQVISSDDILESLASENNITYGEAFNIYAGRAAEECHHNFASALAQKSNIIIDRTNMTRKSRAKFLAMVGAEYERKAIVFRVPRDELVERARIRGEQTGKTIAPWIIDRMISTYEAPGDSEFDEVTFV